jgi:hypothetical protein
MDFYSRNTSLIIYYKVVYRLDLYLFHLPAPEFAELEVRAVLTSRHVREKHTLNQML